MIRYIIISLASGVLFGAMDGLINANPLAQRLYQVFKPVAKTSINVPAAALLYTLAAGLCEMLVLGVFYGLTLKP
jgi:hypothetical protein